MAAHGSEVTGLHELPYHLSGFPCLRCNWSAWDYFTGYLAARASDVTGLCGITLPVIWLIGTEVTSLRGITLPMIWAPVPQR